MPLVGALSSCDFSVLFWGENMRNFTISAIAGALACALPTIVMADDVPKRLAVSDLAVQTHKWDGKTVQTNLYCFFADESDYRCGMATESVFVRIDLHNIQPDDMKKWVEDHCDTTDKMVTRLCSMSITFVYAGNDWQEKPDGSVMMLIIAEDNKATLARAGK